MPALTAAGKPLTIDASAPARAGWGALAYYPSAGGTLILGSGGLALDPRFAFAAGWEHRMWSAVPGRPAWALHQGRETIIMTRRLIAGFAALTVAAGLFAVGTPGVQASSKGRRNTTYGLGAATAYSLLRGKTTQGLILGAGTAYAYKRYRDSRNSEKRRQRAARARYNSRYRTARYNGRPYSRTASYRSRYYRSRR